MDFSKPHIIYFLIWTGSLLLAFIVETPYSVEFGMGFYFLVVGNILSFVLLAPIAKRLIGKRVSNSRRFNKNDLLILRRFIVRLFPLWAIGFLLLVVYSGGLPIFWILSGDGRSYVDFGMPSFSGFLHMLRAFMFSGLILLALNRVGNRSSTFIFLILLSSVFSEISRGGITALLLHAVAFLILFRRSSFSGIAKATLGVFVLAIGFGWLGEFRNVSPNETVAASLGSTLGGGNMVTILTWGFIYLTSPLNNLAYAISQGITPTLFPFFTLQPLVPTIIRDMIFPPGVYPIDLVNEAFNATTYYSPLVADFGVIGAFLISLIIQSVVLLLYYKAKAGDLFCILVYPPVFASVVLSVFYMYYFSLPFILYPIVAAVFVRYRNRYLRRINCVS